MQIGLKYIDTTGREVVQLALHQNEQREVEIPAHVINYCEVLRISRGSKDLWLKTVDIPTDARREDVGSLIERVYLGVDKFISK